MPAVFVFDRGGDLNVFSSLQAASGWLEAVDVDNGEYIAAFLHDGTVVATRTADNLVVLAATDTRDLPRLNDLLTEHQRWVGEPVSGRSPLEFANDYLRYEWAGRWPRRPAWLARRLHGGLPPRVVDER